MDNKWKSRLILDLQVMRRAIVRGLVGRHGESEGRKKLYIKQRENHWTITNRRHDYGSSPSRLALPLPTTSE